MTGVATTTVRTPSRRGHGDRSGHGCPGRDAIVDDDHSTLANVDRRVIAAVAQDATSQLDLLARFDHTKLSDRDTTTSQYVFVDSTHSVLTNGPEREFALMWMAEFADN